MSTVGVSSLYTAAIRCCPSQTAIRASKKSTVNDSLLSVSQPLCRSLSGNSSTLGTAYHKPANLFFRII